MEKRKLPDWIEGFIESFGEFATQQEFVNSITDPSNPDNIDSANLPMDETYTETDKNRPDSKNFEVVVNKKKKKDKNTTRNVGTTVLFASGKNKQNIVQADIDTFCGGRYAYLKDESAENIAKIISKDTDFISNYIEASSIKYLDDASVEEAINLINNLHIKDNMSVGDYNKISSRLNEDNVRAFDDYLIASSIRVSKPIRENVDYYLNYFKDFAEYKLASQGFNTEYNISQLKIRIASMEPAIVSSYGAEGLRTLKSNFKSDQILKNL
jgi:uncharacterized protein YeeX (DUF496 family)